MKKILFFAALTFLGLTASNAQGDIRFGASLGLNISGVTGDDVDNADSRTGFRGGAVVDIGISEKFSFQPVVAISIQGWKELDFDIKANYVVVEAKADYEIVENLSLQAGPLVGFNIHASFDGEDIDNWESTNFGALIAAQYELSNGLFFNLQYDMGFSDLVQDFDARLCNISGSVGFFFN